MKDIDMKTNRKKYPGAKSGYVDFRNCPCYVSRNERPRLLSDMVAEAEKTGQMPTSTPLSPLQTFTEDIDSFELSNSGDDRISSYLRSVKVMDMIDNLDQKKKDALQKYHDAMKMHRDAERAALLESLKNNQ